MSPSRDASPVRNWAGNVTFASTDLRSPTSVEQLQHLVARAERVHALGTRHSFSRLADTDGTFVSCAALEEPIVIDSAAALVWVPAGCRYGELATALQEAGWALGNLGSLPHISVAGACATGTHGSGDTNRCLAAAARSIEYVRADGELITRSAKDPDWAGSVLALGALGVTTRLALEIEPSYDIRQDVWLDLPLPTYLDRFDEIMGAGYSVSVFTDWSRRDTLDLVWVKSRVDATVADGLAWGARAATTAQHPVRGHDASAATEQLGRPGPWAQRLPHFRLQFTPSVGHEQQSEYLLPREHAAAAVAALARLELRPPLLVCEIRTIAADQLWLSPCGGRDTVALHFTWADDDTAVARAVTAVENALIEFDPRPHWGKVFGAVAAEGIRTRYPRSADFRRLVTREDPDRKFGNEFLSRFVY
ncbi:MAG: FAD-binding protein [Actinobacteria bacterium]|nr:FAD-binding protein [Actinomycetota bacterium]